MAIWTTLKTSVRSTTTIRGTQFRLLDWRGVRHSAERGRAWSGNTGSYPRSMLLPTSAPHPQAHLGSRSSGAKAQLAAPHLAVGLLLWAQRSRPGITHSMTCPSLQPLFCRGTRRTSPGRAPPRGFPCSLTPKCNRSRHRMRRMGRPGTWRPLSNCVHRWGN